MKDKSYAHIYSEAFKNFAADREEIQAFANKCQPGSILELGAGSGRTLSFINTHRHVLLESDPEMLALLTARIAGDERYELLKGRCPQIPSESETYSGVFAAFGTIGELSPVCATLQEVKRVLMTNGYFHFTALNPLKYKSPSTGLRRSLDLQIEDFTLVSGTFATPCFGPGEYQTLLYARTANHYQTFTVRQYFPSLEQWLILFQEIGFELETEKKELENATIFSFTLRKREKSFKNVLPIEYVYNEIATNYDLFIKDAQYSLPQWLTPHLSPFVKLNPFVLDLASGNGFVGKLINSIGLKPVSLYGFDISEEMTKVSQSTGLYTNSIRFNLQLGLPGIAAQTADIITAFGLFEFIEDPLALLSDIRRTLISGGTLYCSFEATEDKNESHSIQINMMEKIIYRYPRSIEALSELLSKAKLEIGEIVKRVGYVSPTTNQPVSYYFVKAIKYGI